MHVDPGFDSSTTIPAPATSGATALDAVGFSNRALKRLQAAGATSVEHLAEFTIAELQAIKGFGAGCLAEVRDALAERGLRLKDDT